MSHIFALKDINGQKVGFGYFVRRQVLLSFFHILRFRRLFYLDGIFVNNNSIFLQPLVN